MENTKSKGDVAIVGAGMSGTVLAYILASKGYKVKIYEKRSDCRLDCLKKGRSVNLTLAERGISSLERIGIKREDLFAMCIGLKGRQIHKTDGKLKFQAYGSKEGELIYSIIRHELNCFLLDYVEQSSSVELLFNQECTGLDRNTRTLYFTDKQSGENYEVKPEFVVGADGTYSTVRQLMQRGMRADYRQFFLPSGYKELKIPPNENGEYKLDPSCLHVYPRGESLLLALSNNDGSFTCTCVLPHKGQVSFETLNNKEACKEFFENNYPEILQLVPNAVTSFFEGPINELITTQTSMWSYKDWIVLVGDACHTVTPFYGQGMNTALEGCWILAECIERNEKNLEKAFTEYQDLRQVNTDVLANLSVQNFYELQDKVRYPSIDLMKKVHFFCQKLFPGKWLPLYTMIAHTNIPYAEAIEREKKQNRILKFLGISFFASMLNTGAKMIFLFNEKRKTKVKKANVAEKEIVCNSEPIK